MITTEREYRITKARIKDPEQAIAREQARTDLSRRMRQAYVDALTSNIAEMAAEVRAYEDLKAGRVEVKSVSLAQLPTVLVRARIANGWAQKQLADLLGVNEQTIQRYEATYYQGVALARLVKIAETLSVQVTASARQAATVGTQGLSDDAL